MKSHSLYVFVLALLLSVAALALSGLAARANPGIIRVTVNGATSGTCGDLTNWSNPCDLQYALTSVAVSGDQLWVAAGTYTPMTGISRTVSFQLRNGIALYGGFAMTETVLRQRNYTANVTMLSGDIGTSGDSIDNSYHVVTGSGADSTALLDGFTVTGGNANGTDLDDYGGGMYNSGGSPTLTNVTFISNSAGYAGGMANRQGSSPMLTNVTFSGNSAIVYGGGMYNSYANPMLTNVTFISNTAASNGGGMANESSSSTLTNVTFSGNSANGGGGGMANESSSSTLTNVTFSGNSANGGGGMYNSYANPMLTNVTFISNTAASNGGGMVNGSSSPTLTNVTFSSNIANHGGGMYSYNSSSTLTNVTFSSNSANYGGGMYDHASSSTLTNVTFSSNSAPNYGGGMFEDSSSPTLTNVTFSGNSTNDAGGGMFNYGNSPMLTNVTFSGNTAPNYGGGMFNAYVDSSLTIRNAIFWGNTAGNGPQIHNVSCSLSLSDSVVQGGYGGGTNIIRTDPLLGALGNYGGATATIPLLPGSSAIDAGYDATCATTDQRGVARPQGTHCDIGAYESRGFVFTQSGNNQTTPVNTPFASALVVNVSSAYNDPVDGGAMVFTAPSSGASTNPISRTVTVAGGAAPANFSANGTLGAYVVNATTGNLTFLFGLANLKGNTTTTIVSSENPSAGVHTLTFTVTVVSPSGTPSGTVDFYETISPSAPSARAPRRALASQPLVGGIATFNVSSLGVGTHNLLVLYSGDASFDASISATYPQVVNGLNYYFPLVVR